MSNKSADRETVLAEISKVEGELMDASTRLRELHETLPPLKIPDYEFDSLEGPIKLSDLFAGSDKLLMVHNMGQGCRYCTLWGDGLNPFVQHIENTLPLIMVSGDSPLVQRRFANSRQWRFRMLSHNRQQYYEEQVKDPDYENCPGIACYQRKGSELFRLGHANFGPGDLYCSLWHVLAIAGYSSANWTPQYRYWSRPEQLEDGGSNIVD